MTVFFSSLSYGRDNTVDTKKQDATTPNLFGSKKIKTKKKQQFEFYMSIC